MELSVLLQHPPQSLGTNFGEVVLVVLPVALLVALLVVLLVVLPVVHHEQDAIKGGGTPFDPHQESFFAPQGIISKRFELNFLLTYYNTIYEL